MFIEFTINYLLRLVIIGVVLKRDFIRCVHAYNTLHLINNRSYSYPSHPLEQTENIIEDINDEHRAGIVHPPWILNLTSGSISHRRGLEGFPGDSEFSQSFEWESYTFFQLYDHFKCLDHVNNPTKPLYTSYMWRTLEDLFAKQSGIDLNSSRLHKTHVSKYYSSYAHGKGRGAFAFRNFSKGELVHDGSVSTVFWNDGLSWKRYIMALPSTMLCDVLEWTWIQEVEDYGWLLYIDLNDAAFMNHYDDYNIAPKNNTSLKFYAIRGKKLG